MILLKDYRIKTIYSYQITIRRTRVLKKSLILYDIEISRYNKK
jgi:hypothetical protein